MKLVLNKGFTATDFNVFLSIPKHIRFQCSLSDNDSLCHSSQFMSGLGLVRMPSAILDLLYAVGHYLHQNARLFD